MKSGYLIHVFAAITLLLGIYIFFGDSENPPRDSKLPKEKQDNFPDSTSLAQKPTAKSEKENSGSDDFKANDLSAVESKPQAHPSSKVNASQEKAIDQEPLQLIDDYLLAWQNRDKEQLDHLWSIVSECEACLQEFVELLIAKNLEKGLLLQIAIKMAALDSDVVLPVFDALIVPDGDKSTAIILSEKLINNGRPEFVAKIFDVIYRAQQSGYENFARQLTWVISKLENPLGIEPILDAITGRNTMSPEYTAHVTSVYSKVVRAMPNSSKAATVIADYYKQANSAEQQKLWPVVSQHGNTLVALAVDANRNGQNYNVQKFAEAMTALPHLNAVDSLMRLHTSIEYSPNYLVEMLSKRVADNPTIKVLHKLEDYMRNPTVKLESRIFAAEGLLAVRNNRQARYLLEKVINNTQDPDAELQAFIGGRL